MPKTGASKSSWTCPKAPLLAAATVVALLLPPTLEVSSLSLFFLTVFSSGWGSNIPGDSFI